ncbi:MAG: type VI secretion system baseplate subunit TssE [Neisseriaceae bacterium]|nr:type VI secretion system baseplate subunit TssE [Neisseriaceae bacterium]MBP6863542.1 type VI secretion system baseplate subunit TssE [Neisseriaceae bacterium]
MSIGPSILEKLTQSFDHDVPLALHNAEEQYVLSVMNNIEHILNTRQGSVKHLPDYGLPDLSIIYRHLPSSLSVLQKYITFTLLKYEPRLEGIQVQTIGCHDSDFIIAYELLCCLKKVGYIRYETMFSSEESVQVTGWRRQPV